ncbi:MAG: acetylornithine deacetylase/succinyl-diaminopimelate desuccinylase-like protein [Cellvibrionaceae bacterium]|jgi:acetylornithine deacetylase/succinyl-diaminopimelate desuccinylase-like protein
MLSPLELLQNLIRFDTTNPPGNEIACIEYIAQLLTEAGFKTTLIAKDRNRPNLITRLKGRGEAPPLLFQGHVDVVTTVGQNWTHPPFDGLIKDGFLWGRGTLDMKGAVAMMISAVMRAKADGIVPAGDIILCILSDEENGSDLGAKYLVEEHAEQFEGVQYAIGEFGGWNMEMGGETFFPIQIAEKLGVHLSAKVRGEPGHASGIFRNSAMGKTGRLLAELDRLQMPVHVTPAVRHMLTSLANQLDFPANFMIRRLLNPITAGAAIKIMGKQGALLEPLLKHTINPTIIEGGIKNNVIPHEINLQFDVRILPGFTPEAFLEELLEQLDTDAEFTIIDSDSVLLAEPNMGLYPLLADILKQARPEGFPTPLVLQAVTDARYFSKLGIQTYGFTPLNLPADLDVGRMAHGVDERVPVDSPEFGTQAMVELIKRYEG